MADHLTNRLRLWRAANGVTLEELAGLTGFSVAFLSRVERGQRRLKALDRLRVARCSAVDQLFDPDDAMADTDAAAS